MSISSITTKNSFSYIRERLGFEFKLHGHEIIVGAIMTTVSIAIAFAITGDVNDAMARQGRHS
jgi:hypothetical protein